MLGDTVRRELDLNRAHLLNQFSMDNREVSSIHSLLYCLQSIVLYLPIIFFCFVHVMFISLVLLLPSFFPFFAHIFILLHFPPSPSIHLLFSQHFYLVSFTLTNSIREPFSGLFLNSNVLMVNLARF